jgi:hypothetical protein
MDPGVREAAALLYLDPKDESINFKGILNDSIPLMTGEHVVMERKELVARWVVAIVNLSYEEMKKRIEDSVRSNFGIEQAQERSVRVENFSRVDPDMPEDPLLGDGFEGFHQLVPGMKSAREYQIVSKEFNRLAKVDGYSISKWRIGDGREIFSRAWSIVVVERADYSREWARDHTGIPWPFKISGTNWLVTETEVALIDRLKVESKAVTVKYFVPYPAYNTGAVLELMNSILKEADKMGEK